MFFWSTGFVVAHYATDDAAPLTFLALRLALTTVLLGGVAVASGLPRPSGRSVGWLALTGVLLHAVYLGGVFVAIDHGMPSGVTALIAGLHPVLTSVLAGRVLGEHLSRRQWVGVGLGLAGVSAVVLDRLAARSAGITLFGVVAVVVAMVGISAGTLLQRRHSSNAPLLWGSTVQYAVATVVLSAGAAGEGFDIHFTVRTLFALAWAVLVLSVVAVLIMLWLLGRHAAARVSSLFFLTPALSAIEGAILFRERLGVLALVGLAIALGGVALVTRPRPA